jgi:large subunit ribosomal protein L17
MKKRKQGKKFHRKKDQREALMQGLIEALTKNEAITTTETRAKETRRKVEKLITKLSKKDKANALREAKKDLSPSTARKLIEEIVPRYEERPGGYVRILKLGPRKSDGTEMARIQFV